MNLVSVIIPVYNVEAYLERCISSVGNQTYQSIQLVLVDDGSTDRSGEICDAWAAKDSRVTVIHQENGGVSAARNTGLEKACGEYILWVDSDDYIAPDAVEKLINSALRTNADMVICDFVKGAEENHSFHNLQPQNSNVIGREEALGRIYTGSHNALRYAAPWAKLGRRALYQDIVYPQGKIFEDIYTTHKLLCRCERIAVLDEQLVYYFQRPDSIMNMSFSMKKLDYLPALVERVAFFRDNGLTELSETAYDELLHALIWEYSRTRDLLHSEEGMAYIRTLFRAEYRAGYASKRYPKENRLFLAAFAVEPELIVGYWRIAGKLKKVLKRNE